MRLSLLPCLLLSVPLTALACSGAAIDDQSDASDSNTNSIGDGDSGDGDSGDGDTANECNALPDLLGETLTVEIVNERRTPIYFGGDAGSGESDPSLYRILTDVADFNTAGFNSCGQTCAAIMNDGYETCSVTTAAEIPGVRRLDPGETATRVQLAQTGIAREISPSCASDIPDSALNDGLLSCAQVQPFAPGTYTFSAHAASGVSCDFIGGSGECGECTPGEQGGCHIPSAVLEGDQFEAEAELIIQPEPEDEDNASPPTDRFAPLSVRLVFSDPE